MPLSYEIDEDHNLLVVTGTERVTLDDVLSHQRELQADPRLKPGIRCLVDLREMKGLTMSGRDTFRLAQAREQFPYLAMQARTAIVVKSAIHFAMARMYALSRRKYVEPMAIFYDLDEARHWVLS
jgi:hypothetical protein